MAEPDLGGTTQEGSPVVAPVEALPGERELELEVLLKERDEHLTRLANEVRSLRRRLPASEQASTEDPFTLPPPLANLLLPLLSKSSLGSNLAAASGQALSGPASATVTAALTARLAALHQENEELYELLKRGSVGRLHEEVRELRVTARKLEGALQESHTTISQLKTELEEAYRVIERRSKRSRSGGKSQSRSRSPINHYKQQPQSFASRHQPDTKPIPTGPRALKKPRLSNPSQEYPSSSGYRSNGRSTPPVGIKQEEDSRMKVEEDDHETRGSAGRDDDQYSDYYRPKSEQYSQYSRSRSRTPKRLGSETLDSDRPKSRSRSRSQAMDDRSPSVERSPSPRRSQGRRDSYSSGRPRRSPSRSPARSRSADRQARSPTPPSPDVDETRTRSYSRTRSSVHSPVSRRRSLSRTKSSPRSSRRYSRSPPRQRRSPTPEHSPPRRSRSPSRLRIQGAARRLEDRQGRQERERPLRRASPTRHRGADQRPSPRDTRAERERERGHRDTKGKTVEREKEQRGSFSGGNGDAFGNGRRKRHGKGGQKHGGGGSGSFGARNGSNPGSGVGSLASRIK
ncbi:hypothetical protein FRC01_013093 [Tulasnella sp. 417]|nr:hypothetical protein FRC01_013093 [Tulasnella sp. 417]